MRRCITAIFGILALALVGAGCSIMPTTGPEIGEIYRGGDTDDPTRLPYALVKITPQVIDTLTSYAPRIGTVFPDRRPPREITFGIGDSVSVSIFEAAAGRALGRTPSQVQQQIVDAIKNRAIEPQAVVSLVDQRTSLISVLGEVNLPNRFPANYAGEHILDSVTRAGGPKGPGHETWVMLQREGRRATAPFGALVYEPSNNIWTHPGDTIYLYREPQTFAAFGALSANTISGGVQGVVNFGEWRISLTEALGKASGLSDALAEPSAVFLYRGEIREVAERLGIDCSRFPGPIIPVIYNLNLRNPDGFMLATKFQMRNKDVLYVANATSVEISKALAYIRLIVGTVNDPLIAANNAYLLNGLVRTNNRFPIGLSSSPPF